MLHRDRIKIDELLIQFNKNVNYDEKQLYLIKQINSCLSTFVQDENCIRNKTHVDTPNQRLHDILCDMSFYYTPINHPEHRLNKNMITRTNYITKGVNGEIYKNVLFGNQFIVKVPIQLDKEYISELYINFIAINKLLLHNILITNLVPTYGFFLCQGGEDNCRQQKEDDRNKIYIIQKYVGNDTLKKLLVNGTINTVEKLMPYLVEIFTTLIILEECHLHISHNDLHCGNIMIYEGHAYVIDYGYASFSINHVGFKNKYFNKTVGGDYIKILGKKQLHFHTGAQDYYKLLSSILVLKEVNETVKDFIYDNLLKGFHENFYFIETDNIKKFTEEMLYSDIAKVNYLMLINMLNKTYVKKIPIELIEKVNKLNIKVLQKLTMKTLFINYFSDYTIIDVDNINLKIAQTNRALKSNIEQEFIPNEDEEKIELIIDEIPIINEIPKLGRFKYFSNKSDVGSNKSSVLSSVLSEPISIKEKPKSPDWSIVKESPDWSIVKESPDWSIVKDEEEPYEKQDEEFRQFIRKLDSRIQIPNQGKKIKKSKGKIKKSKGKKIKKSKGKNKKSKGKNKKSKGKNKKSKGKK